METLYKQKKFAVARLSLLNCRIQIPGARIFLTHRHYTIPFSGSRNRMDKILFGKIHGHFGKID
jgi:hypothetical protein